MIYMICIYIYIYIIMYIKNTRYSLYDSPCRYFAPSRPPHLMWRSFWALHSRLVLQTTDPRPGFVNVHLSPLIKHLQTI